MLLSRKSGLWQLAVGQRLRYVAAVVVMAVAIAIAFVEPLIVAGAIDSLMEGGPWAWSDRFPFVFDSVQSFLVATAAVIIGLTIVAGGFQYLRDRWAAVASESLTRRLRDRLLAHIERLPCATLDKLDTGDLVQRCSSDVETIRVFLSQHVIEIGRAILLVLIALPIMLSISPMLTLVSMGLMPLILLFAIAFFARVKRDFLQVDEAEARMTATLQENLTGIRVVRAFARQPYEQEKFAANNREFRNLNHRLIQTLGLYWASSDFLCLIQSGLVLVAGGLMTLDGQVTIGTLFAFMTYEAMVIWPVRHLGRILMDTGKATVALKRVSEILDHEEEPEPLQPTGQAAIGAGRVEVQRLWAHFGGDVAALSDVSFTLEPGQTLALVGHAGSGKSTLAHLLLRLYAYEKGSIKLDGVELNDLPNDAVRAEISAVLQEPFLYSGTVAHNLKVGKARALQDELEHAADLAAIGGTIRSFPDGYGTWLGERGVNLSGGQRQRLALARALLADPSVLILDDALSAVDTETERHILSALEGRAGRRTTIIIAHRLSSVVHANEILVLQQGRVVQRGTHNSLKAQPGQYQSLWRIQGDIDADVRRDLEGLEKESV